MRKLIGTVFTMFVGAVIGIVAFIAAICKAGKKVAAVADIPQFVIIFIKDAIVAGVSYLLYGDRDALQKKATRRPPYFRYDSYRYQPHSNRRFDFATWEEAHEFIINVRDKYCANNNVLRMSEARALAYNQEVFLDFDLHNGWDKRHEYDIMYNLIPKNNCNYTPNSSDWKCWYVEFPKPVELVER